MALEELMQKREDELDLEILNCKVKSYGWPVAHVMAERGYKFKSKKILKIADWFGKTVAHVMAEKGYVFNDKEILRLATQNGWTVAHEMAKQGYKFTDKEILKLADENGWTVAHVMVYKGYTFTDKEILQLLNTSWLSVLFSFGKKERIKIFMPSKLLFVSGRDDLSDMNLLKYFNRFFTRRKMKEAIKAETKAKVNKEHSRKF